MLSGVRIIGVKVKQNTLVTLKLHSGVINMKLNVELVPCHLGHAYDKETQQCQCYTTDNIASCGISTTIRKNYWFGIIDEQATVSVCPSRYCNYFRTEVISGMFLLSTFYDDQCGPHRAGQACGTCENGYSFPFDFEYCVNNENCSPEITVLIIICVILFWIMIVAIILLIKHFKINIGYLYGIIYYYSVVDMLLGQIVLNYSSSLNVLDKIVSSIIRLSPGFVGFLCFFKGMSGIDQYALRFIHPTGIIALLILVGALARCSGRIVEMESFHQFVSF